MADTLEDRAKSVVRRLNGWQVGPFDPADHELAVNDVYVALRAAATDALKELSRTSQVFDEDAAAALVVRIAKGEF